jgi:hypothetical protein
MNHNKISIEPTQGYVENTMMDGKKACFTNTLGTCAGPLTHAFKSYFARCEVVAGHDPIFVDIPAVIDPASW